jgi:EmrB/QacA subfamily drug resistance transporter
MMNATTAGPGPARDHPDHSHRWWILIVLGLAQLMVILDATIVNIALPSAQRDLGFSDDSRQWVVTAYALAFGGLLLLGGRVADLVGPKRTLLAGLLGFGAASAVGGAAGSLRMLLAARAAQGLFGALLAPAVLSLLTTTFTEARERNRAFGVYGAIGGAGGAAGLLLGGVLTEYLDWRWCLYVNLFLAAVTLAGAATLIRPAPVDERPRLDLPGTVTASAGLFAVVYGLANAQTHSWSDAGTWAVLTAGVALLAVFAALQARVSHPLLPPRVILDRNRGGSFLAVFVIGVGIFGIFLFLTYYLQQTLGFSPVRAGLAFLPVIGGVVVCATTATMTLLPRFGPRPLVGVGMLVAAAGLLWLSALDVDSGYATDVLPPMIVSGLGLGLAIAPATRVAVTGLNPHDAGVGSAAVNTAQQIGGSIGIALLSTVAASAGRRDIRGKQLTPAAIAHAAVHSYTTAFTWAAVIFAVGAVLCALLLRPGRLDDGPAQDTAQSHDTDDTDDADVAPGAPGAPPVTGADGTAAPAR